MFIVYEIHKRQQLYTCIFNIHENLIQAAISESHSAPCVFHSRNTRKSQGHWSGSLSHHNCGLWYTCLCVFNRASLYVTGLRWKASNLPWMTVDISVAFRNQGPFRSDYYPYDICLGDSTFFASELYFLAIVMEKAMAPHSSTLAWKSHGWRSLVGCSPWGRQESDTTEWLHFHFSLSCPGEGNGNPLQCSCLENPRDGGTWWAAVYGVAQSRTWLKRLSSSSSYSEDVTTWWQHI